MRGTVLALLVGLVAGGGASCIESDDEQLVFTEQNADELPPTKCYDFTKGVGNSSTWKLGDEDIDKWVICYTPRKGYVSYGDDEKCDTLEVTITIRGYKKTGTKDGKPIYTLYFTNGAGTTITMPMCSDKIGWKSLVKIMAALKKIGIKWTDMKVGFPDDPNRVTYKPGDPGADDYMKTLIDEILRNVRIGKPTKTWERKEKTKEVPEKMSYNDFNRLDTWPVGVTEIEVTGTDVWDCPEVLTAEADVLTGPFAAAIAPCLPPPDAEVDIVELEGDVVDTLGALYIETLEVGLDVIDELDEADADGRLDHLYDVIFEIDPGEFSDDDNCPTTVNDNPLPTPEGQE
jgi:hypothetical protein